MAEGKCVFCSIAAGQIPSKVVYQDDAVTSVLDINPASKGHTLVIPKQHFNSIYEIPQNQFLQIMAVADAVGYSILLAQAPKNVDMLYTQEIVKGNVTPHALIHLIPRYDEDSINYAWNPEKLTEEELDSIANGIVQAIEKVRASEKPVQPAEKRQEEAPKKQEIPPAPEEKPKEISRKIVVF